MQVFGYIFGKEFKIQQSLARHDRKSGSANWKLEK